jgi:hypothetical protein
MAVSHYIEHQTGWSIKEFVRTAPRYRRVKIKAGNQALTAADALHPTTPATHLSRSASTVRTNLSQVRL